MIESDSFVYVTPSGILVGKKEQNGILPIKNPEQEAPETFNNLRNELVTLKNTGRGKPQPLDSKLKAVINVI